MSIPHAEELLRVTGAQPAAEEPPEPGRDRLRAVPDAREELQEPGRRSSGRERHEEKITVYISSGELVELERARLTLRAHHGLAVDRGRLVREAVAVVLEDLEARGEESTLVRRLRPAD
jgi:hypothetical protein